MRDLYIKSYAYLDELGSIHTLTKKLYGHHLSELSPPTFILFSTGGVAIGPFSKF